MAACQTWEREPLVFGVGDDEMTRLRSCSNVGVIALVLVLVLLGAGCSAESSDSDGTESVRQPDIGSGSHSVLMPSVVGV
jgi:hypothetical protein